MSGVKGRSGRRPLSEEVRRHAIRQKAWEVTGQYLNSVETELEKRAQLAVGIVKADMAKPIIIDQSENHTHLTTVNVKEMSREDLIAFTTGRNGRTGEPSRKS